LLSVTVFIELIIKPSTCNTGKLRVMNQMIFSRLLLVYCNKWLFQLRRLSIYYYENLITSSAI